MTEDHGTDIKAVARRTTGQPVHASDLEDLERRIAKRSLTKRSGPG
jgi:hypothetical protein